MVELHAVIDDGDHHIRAAASNLPGSGQVDGVDPPCAIRAVEGKDASFEGGSCALAEMLSSMVRKIAGMMGRCAIEILDPGFSDNLLIGDALT